MKTPVIILPVILGNSTLPQVPYDQIENLPEYETDASDHWIFDKGGVGNLIGGLAGTALQPVGSAPTYAAKSLTLADGGMHGLTSDFADSGLTTLCGVFQRRALLNGVNGVPLMGSLAFDSAAGGSGLYDFAGGIVNGRTRPGAGTGVPNTSGITVGQWYFAAIVNKNGVATYYVGGIDSSTETQAKAVSTRTYALGNAYIANEGYYEGCTAAEFMIFRGFGKTLAELDAIYARTKVRMARRGISIR